MPFNRINGFYVGNRSLQEPKPMTLDERNGEVNQSLEFRFTQLNAAYEKHEADLKSMRVSKNVWAVYRSESDEEHPQEYPNGQYEWAIGMIKLNGTWRLCHGHRYESYDGWRDQDYGWKPIVESSIEDRINASIHIDKLREAVVASKEKLVPDLEKAIATLVGSLSEG